MIMPCYNAEDYIIDALESVSKQTYKNFTLICCDDKSTDNTFSVLENNQFKYNYTLVNNDVNLGTGETVNKIIRENPQYEFITWISADNILMPNFLEKHIEKIKKGFAITYSAWSMFGNKKNPKLVPHPNLLKLKSTFELGPSFLFRKKLWDIAGPFNSLPGEDYYFAVNAILNNAKFGFIWDVLLSYRNHNNSVSGRLRQDSSLLVCTGETKSNAQKITVSNGELSYAA
jgi:glycosyltransferase involved in cell wall biosynthesis